MAEIIFWLSLLLILQTYALYPLTVWLLRALRRGPAASAGATVVERLPEPMVSVVIAVYNEELHIRERIDNIFSSNYPAANLELLVGSDGSTDGTDDIMKAHGAPGLRTFCFTVRRGKVGILNDLLPQTRGELVVFSDANTSFDPAAIRELVTQFSDSAVGAVTGELVLHSAHGSVGGDGEVSYWKFENWLKAAESDIKTTLGASGGIYAIRRELWRPLPYPKGIVDDFVIPMNVLLADRVVRYHRAARAYERAAGSVSGEFARKIRIGASNFNGIPEYAKLLSPTRGFVAFALWSHKIIRWFVPFLLLAFGATGAALCGTSPLYTWVGGLTAAFGLAAIAGAAAEKFGWRVGVLGYPYYFLAMNFALFLGFFRSIAGKQRALWETVR